MSIYLSIYLSCVPTFQGQTVKGQGHMVTWRIGRQKRDNSAVYGRINFKSGGNYLRLGRRVWYTF